MLNLQDIEAQYPEHLRAFKRNILREYLQYKILEIIFNSPCTAKLSFLGGTALRIVYQNKRFSEDLDFDNFGMTQTEFSQLAKEVKQELEREGYIAETHTVFKRAYRCKVRIPRLLFENDLSVFREEKILIQLDTSPHHFSYVPTTKTLNKFDVFTQIRVTPPDILLSQKIYAVFNRKRAMGRDFYDIVFLLSFTKPNYQYLEQKLRIRNGVELRKRLLSKIESLDFDKLRQDVQAFLTFPQDGRKIELFREYLQEVDLGE